MPAAIGNMGCDGVDPIQWIEEPKGGAGAGIGRCCELDQSVMAADAVGRERGACDVACQPLELFGILGRERLSGEDGKPGMHPGKKVFHETFRKTFLLMQALQEKTAKQLANRGGIERGEFEKLSSPGPDSIGNDGMAMRMEVGPIGTEGLNRQHTAGPNIFTVKQCLEGSADGLISGAGKEAQKAAFSLEEAADGFGNSEDPVSISYWREYVVCEFLGKQSRPLGLTTIAKIASAT